MDGELQTICRSTGVNKKAFDMVKGFKVVGMRGFEPPTSRTLSGYSNRTEPHPEYLLQTY